MSVVEFWSIGFRCTVVSLLNSSGDMWLPTHREAAREDEERAVIYRGTDEQT